MSLDREEPPRKNLTLTEMIPIFVLAFLLGFAIGWVIFS